MESIVAAIVTGAVTLLGVVLANNRQSAVMAEKIDTLSKRVEKHNSVVERVYKLEAQPQACEEKFKTIFNDIGRLEQK